MVRAATRAYTRESRIGRFLLPSLMFHVLVVVLLNLTWRPWEELRPAQKEQKPNPIQVSFIRPENTEEPKKAEVFAETSSRAETPEGPKAEVAKSDKTILPKEQQAPSEAAPPSKPQVHEEAPPQVARPPIAVAPTPAPEVATKRPSSPPHRQETAKASPPKAERAPAEQPAPKRLAKPPEPAERTPRRPPLERAPAEQPEPKRLAKLPEPAEHSPGGPRQEPRPSARPGLESPSPFEQTGLPRFGHVPLLNGEDLEKYAQVRSSDQSSSSGGAVSLDTKELKYLSYFAHIKRRIERVWTYPADAIASGSQGQLHLKFVLRRNGQLKTIELLRSSGSKVLDKEAWDAVVNAGPFESFPPTIPEDELHIAARFTYVLDEAVQRIRMR
jgi:periplasmic protein TonB